MRGRWSPHRRGTATDRQRAYLRRLLNEAFARLIRGGPNLDPHHLENVSRAEASAAIDRLRALLGRDRQGDTPVATDDTGR